MGRPFLGQRRFRPTANSLAGVRQTEAKSAAFGGLGQPVLQPKLGSCGRRISASIHTRNRLQKQRLSPKGDLRSSWNLLVATAEKVWWVNCRI